MSGWCQYPLVILAGFAAGFINTLAGSGSALSLPMLHALGLPMDVANGTNRIAIVLQTLVASRTFHVRGRMDWKQAGWLAVPTMLGGVAGAMIAVSLNTRLLQRAVGVVMLVILGLLFARPRRWLEGAGRPAARRPGPGMLALCFGIGVYGGFIQIGVGVFLLAALVLGSGLDLVRANGVKVAVIFALTLPALAVFVAHGQVRWGAGLLLACGNMLGAWTAGREAARRGAGFVRWILVLVVSGAALKYLVFSP